MDNRPRLLTEKEIELYLVKNECIAQTLVHTVDITYAEAKSFVADLIRSRNKKSISGATFKLALVEQRFDIKIEAQGIDIEGEKYKQMKFTYKVKGETKYASITVGRFLKENPEGKFMIWLKDRAIAIVDGEIVYGEATPKTRIEKAFKVIK